MMMNEPFFVQDQLSKPNSNMVAQESNSLKEDMSVHLDTLFCLWANKTLHLLLNAACLAEK